jgi:hypothetical protein
MESTKKCLLVDGGLPSKEVLQYHQPVQFGPDILREHLDIEPDWVKFTLADVEVNGLDELYVYYACMIPSVIDTKIGEWVEIGRIKNGFVQKMVYEAACKILSEF